MKKDKKEILREDIDSYLEKRASGPHSQKKQFSFSGFFKKSGKNKIQSEKSPAESPNDDFKTSGQGGENQDIPDSGNIAEAKGTGKEPKIPEHAKEEKEIDVQAKDEFAKESDGGSNQMKKDSIRIVEIGKLVIENLDLAHRSGLESSNEFKKLKDACRD